MPSFVPRSLLVVAWLGAPLLGVAAGADAQRAPVAPPVDLWSEPSPGVRYLRRTTSLPCTIHALVVDLSAEGVAIEATPYASRWRTVAEFARQGDYVAAVNGGFWGPLASAQGVTAGGGARWPDGTDDGEHGFFAVGRDGRAWISPPEEVWEDIPPARLAHAVSGRPMLVRAGAVDEAGLAQNEFSRRRHPRTAVGVSRDGRRVAIVVADGRQETSKGLTLFELATLMVELGASEAINLDGGGSSTMFVDPLGGVVNAPSGGRWEVMLGMGAAPAAPPAATKQRTARDGLEESFVRGVEREVMNHLAVVAPRPRGGEPRGHDLLGSVPSLRDRAAPRPPTMRLGRARELVYPLAYALGALVPLLLLLAWVRRRRARVRAPLARGEGSGPPPDGPVLPQRTEQGESVGKPEHFAAGPSAPAARRET